LHCTILAIGSRGDVHPLIALGAGLHAAGHTVRIATHADFEQDVRSRGMEFFQLTGNAARFYGGPTAAVLQDRARDARAFSAFFNNYLDLFLRKVLAGCWEACQGTDLILSWSVLAGIGPALAERLRIPVVQVASFPVNFPTSEFASPWWGALDHIAPNTVGTAAQNLETWKQFSATAIAGVGARQRWRQETLGLPEITWEEEAAQARLLPHIFGYSPSVLPKPADWPAWAHVTGYWLLDAPQSYTPPPEVAAFLERHPNPVVLGFSSQSVRKTHGTTALVLEALRRLQQPAVLIAGFGGLRTRSNKAQEGADAALDTPELPDYVLQVPSIPYNWLLPRAAAMVHHGGAGSTAMALRAGVPNMAVPFGYDQLMWGTRIAAIGAGVPPILSDELTAERLADSLRRLIDDAALRRGAASIREILLQEDGVANAVRVVESCAG